MLLCAHEMRHTCKEKCTGFPFLHQCLPPTAVCRLSSEFGNAAEFSWLYNRIGHEQEIRAFHSKVPIHTEREIERETEGEKGSLPVRILAGCAFGTADLLLHSTGAPHKSHRKLINSGACMFLHILYPILDFKGNHLDVLLKQWKDVVHWCHLNTGSRVLAFLT